MKLLVINPNTCKEMTDSIKKTALSAAFPGTELTVINPETGPVALESFYDYSLASYAMIKTLRKMELNRYSGLLVACFGDPGLYALKEKLPFPVVGIAESALSLSLLLGERFSIITASKKAVPMTRNMARQYGLTARLGGVYPLNLSVLTVEREKEKAYRALLRVAEQAAADCADVLILGCAGMTSFADRLKKESGMTVIDPVAAGVKSLESIVCMGYNLSAGGLYAPPAEQEIINPEKLFPKDD